MTIGSVEPLKRLHEKWGDQVQFVDILVRQAHPGPDVPAYESLPHKLEDARRYRKEHGIPWPVLADDLPGKAHQVYGGLSDPAYLIDSAGRVAFYNLWTNPDALDGAIARLVAQGGRGVAGDGIAGRPSLGPVLTGGWPAIRRGLPQSYIDLETALPGGATTLFLGQFAQAWYERRRERRGAEETSVAVPALVVAGAVAGAVIGLLLFRRFRAEPT